MEYSREQKNAWVRNWCKANPEKRRRSQRKHKRRYLLGKTKQRSEKLYGENSYLKPYGITVDQLLELYAYQDDRCLIYCRFVELCVDHDHLTGEVRGLLCRRCNAVLGFIESNLYSRAITYLNYDEVHRQPINKT